MFRRKVLDIWMCFKCAGSGVVDVTCNRRNGTGEFQGICRACGGNGEFVYRDSGKKAPCKKCNATGWFTAPCKKCNQTGTKELECNKCDGTGLFFDPRAKSNIPKIF